MTSAATLIRLLDLRRAKEKRALDALMRHDGDYRRAERRLEAARQAVARSKTQAQRRERAQIQALIGRPVSPAAMARLQADLDAVMVETEKLRDDERAAQAALDETERARDAAREHFRLCQRAAAKLDRLAAEQRQLETRRQAALDEAELEERIAPDAGFTCTEPHPA
jgi:hypothetical protein